jgi:hypothetical protein
VLWGCQPCRKINELNCRMPAGSHEVEGSNPSRSTKLILTIQSFNCCERRAAYIAKDAIPHCETPPAGPNGLTDLEGIQQMAKNSTVVRRENFSVLVGNAQDIERSRLEDIVVLTRPAFTEAFPLSQFMGFAQVGVHR